MSVASNPSVAARSVANGRSFGPREMWRDYRSGISVRGVLLFAAGYYLSVQWGEHLYGKLAVPSPFWLPDAVLLSTFLLTQKRHWPLVAVAVIPIRLAAGAVSGTPLWFLLFASANDLLKALFAAWLLLRVLRRPVRLDTLRQFVVFLGIAAGIAPTLSALLAAAGRHILGDAPISAAYRWFLGDALAQAIVTPTILYWYAACRQGIYPRLKELLFLCSGLIAVMSYAFLLGAVPYSPILSYAPVPFVIWAALRLRPLGTATVISLVASGSMLSAVEGIGLFSKGSPTQNVLSLQFFLLVVSIPLLALAIIIDERKRAEETLRESEDRFRRVFQDAGVGMLIVSPDGLILAANNAFCECLGYREEELIQRTVESLTHPEDWPAFSGKLMDALAREGGFQKFEKRCLHKSGRIVHTESSASLIRGANGQPRYFVGEMLDITERKLAEEVRATVSQKLIEAHEEERTWIARELHDDVNQRLALLAVNLDALKQELPPSDGQAKSRIEEANRQVGDLVRDLQALSHRLHSSKLEYLGLAAASASFCKEVSKRQNVEIDFQSHAIPAKLPQDAALCLFRVLQEALQNATKHSGVKRFEVSLKGSLNEIQLSVHDAGVGFDVDEAVKGHGLGLTSMKERLKLVDGQLLIESKPQGGTNIHASVPLSPRMKAVAAAG